MILFDKLSATYHFTLLFYHVHYYVIEPLSRIIYSFLGNEAKKKKKKKKKSYRIISKELRQRGNTINNILKPIIDELSSLTEIFQYIIELYQLYSNKIFISTEQVTTGYTDQSSLFKPNTDYIVPNGLFKEYNSKKRVINSSIINNTTNDIYF